MNNNLTATDNVSTVLASCASMMYALRVLRSHGLSEQSLKDVFQATVVGKLLYCATAWSGFCSAADCTRLNSFLRRCHKLGYTDNNNSDISTMFQEADDALFRTILSNASHVLHTFLSERPDTTYELDLTINYSFQKLATLAIDTLLLGLVTKTYIDVIITHHTELIC